MMLQLLCVSVILVLTAQTSDASSYRCSRHHESDWNRFLGGRVDEGSRYDCSRSSRGGQCVALLKCKCGLPATHSWHADIKISDVCGPHRTHSLPIGTAIATFDSRNAYYGNRVGHITDHAAVFLGCTSHHGVKVLEQGCSIAIRKHEYSSSSNYFRRFYSIKCRSGTSCAGYPSSVCNEHYPLGR